LRIAIFEDQTYSNFYPLALTRPVFELRCGQTTLSEKILRAHPGAQVCYFVRDWIAPTFLKRAVSLVNDLKALERGDPVLLINGRWLYPNEPVASDGPEEVGRCGGATAYVRAKAATIARLQLSSFDELLPALEKALPSREVKATLLGFIWDTIAYNAEAITADFEAAGKRGLKGKLHQMSCVYGDQDRAYIAESAEVQPMVVIDTKHGPVTIDDDVVVNPHTRIEGPAYIGKGTWLVGGKIREGTSIGPMCRVGGEVEEAIIHGYSNKYHDGFLGHAYVGEWVNLGALTTNSDLKNDYGDVEVYMGGKLTNTGQTKVGSFIGDHTKTSIGTLLNTGTIVGMMCLILGGGGILPKYLPSFCWFYDNKVSKGGGLDAGLTTARTAMSRRKVALTEEDIALYRYVRDLTKDERNEIVRKYRKSREE